MGELDGFRVPYSPGGLTTRSRRRINARRNGRKGGLASGIKRRQLAHGPREPRNRSRQQALALGYRHRQRTRPEVEKLYEEAFPRPERASAAVAWEKGRETLVVYYQDLWRLYRARGQHSATTKGQRAISLEHRDRARCLRTIRRLNLKLERLGLAVLAHDRRGGSMPGNKDRLVLEIRTPSISHVTPPLRGSRNPPHPGEVPTAGPREVIENRPREDDLSPPPPAADDVGRPSAPERPITRREELEAEIRFARMKVEAGFAVAQARGQLHLLEAELRALDQCPNPDLAPGRARPRGSACEGRPG